MPKTAQKKNPAIFYIVMAAIPILLLIVLEMALRALMDDPITPLVLLREVDGRKFYQLNSRVGERFFRGGVAAIPEVYPEKFSYEKTQNTLRVFCLGSSTMASFPYELNARVSSLLRDRLQVAFPDKKVEVINAGMAAINSYAVGEFIRELVDYQPDLFVMYMGHNEFYGALGVGSTQTMGQHRGLIRAYLRLQKFRLFQVIQRLIQSLRKSEPQLNTANQTLMEGMAQEKIIPMQSELFTRGVEQFRSNLEDLIEVAKQHRAPILIGTLASNLRDMEPFESGFAPERTEADKQRWQRLFERGRRLQRADSLDAALHAYSQAGAIDDEPAILHYRIAELYLARRDSSHALQEFKRARDLDMLRFRAPSLFNDIIRESCKKFSIPVVEVEEILAHRSPHRIIGHELISEHLHPNFDGYSLMAKAFAGAIFASQAVKSDERSQPSPDDVFFHEYSAVTEFDLAVGERKIERLISRWPFRRGQFRASASFEGDKKVISLVEEYQSNKISWNEAHHQLAEFFHHRGDFERAIREYQAVVKVIPENDSPYTRIADLLIQKNQYARAVEVLEKAVEWNDRSPFLYAKLGLVRFLQRDFRGAAGHFQKALAVNQDRWLMPSTDLSSANYYLALSEIQIGSYEPAKLHLEETLRQNPRHPEAGRLLALLRQGVPVQLQF
jgi:tetratricopeptide (TPR) repeat protein